VKKALTVFAALLAGCSARPTRPEPGRILRDVAEVSGLRFRHDPHLGREHHLPEIMGSGAALLDYDSDGDLDVYLIQSGPGGNRMFRNELVPGGQLRFTDVTAQTATGHSGYDMGVATGDYDGDGNTDLFVTAFGPSALYRNRGNGTFEDVTRASGISDARWSTSAAFLDYDKDGDLDLFTAAYVDFTVKGNVPCFDASGARDYCNPSVYRPLPDRLYRNDNGKFVDVSAQAGLGAAFGNGLGVSCADFDGDGWPDIFVANDGNANQLWINQRDGTFRDTALEAGVAYNADGAAQAGMGIATADFDNDGDEDLFVTHLAKETNVLYVNGGKGVFTDLTIPFRLNRVAVAGTGFGTAWADFDNDGFLDLFIANGAVTAVESQRGEPYPYRQRNQLFRNEAGKWFREAPLAALPLEVSRGAAIGDIDNDGDLDVLVSNNNGPARLLLNDSPRAGHWLRVRVEKAPPGTRVVLHRPGMPPLWRRVHTDGSYLSASDPRVHFGLGANPGGPSRLEVIRPSGARQTILVPGVDREIAVVAPSIKIKPGNP